MRLLVIEDEAPLAEAIAIGLKAEGFEVDVCLDGLDGLWRAREYAYAAIVCDILLPGMNGYKICRHLREEGITTPILMLTAKTGTQDEAEALDTGADDFLAKPFSFVVLVARLRALLRRSQVTRPPVLRAGTLRLDPGARTCTLDDAPIDLTPREFAVLEQLLRRGGDVVRRADLLEDVWGPDHPGDPKVVDVYIRYLRRKLDEVAGRSIIRTVRGVGYQIPEGAA